MLPKPKQGFPSVNPSRSSSKSTLANDIHEQANMDVRIGETVYQPDSELPFFADEARLGLQHYNQETGARLELVRVVKASVQTACGPVYRFIVETTNGSGVKKYYRFSSYQKKIKNHWPWVNEVKDLSLDPLPDNCKYQYDMIISRPDTHSTPDSPRRRPEAPQSSPEVANAEPFVSSRSTGLPTKWDSPTGNVVLVNKPKGWTSFTVCEKLLRLVNVIKGGHAGTLDPMATGLLIVCVGEATKLVGRYRGLMRSYSGVFRLGEATSTLDTDSPVIQRKPWEHISDDDIKEVAASLRGDMHQVPPMIAAIIVGDERAWAMRGESIEFSPRIVTIFQFKIERSLDDRQNLNFEVICSNGTYIRSLCAEVGKALGSCAHLTALRRDSMGDRGQYSADDAWDFNELEEAIEGRAKGLD